MSKNYLSIQIGERTCNLKYNMGAMETIVELSGSEIDVVVIKDVAINIYAGMVGNCIAKDIEPDFSFDDVKKWVKKLDFDEAKELAEKVNDVVLASYRQTPVEGVADTREQALNVA